MRLFRITLLALLFIGPYIYCYGQEEEKSNKEIFDDALFFYERNEHKEALFNFRELYVNDPDNAMLNYKIAMCYFNIPGQELKAIPYLKKASKNISDNYRPYAFNEKNAPIHTLFYLGKAYRLSGDIDQAVKTIKKFKASPYFLKYNENIVNREVETCKRARVLIDNPVDYEKKNLGPRINDEKKNQRPVVSGDEEKMVFITSLKLYDAVFYTEKYKGAWMEPKNISAEIGSDGDFYPTSLSFKGNELYLTAKNEKDNWDIYVSHFKNGRWSTATPLGRSINSRHNEKHAAISNDGKTLYFATDHRGKGKLDIYYAERKDDGSWRRARNLSRDINTEYNENTPFITANDKILFFSSEGHYNMGEYDVFYTFYDEEKDEWSKPQNVGYPLNTTTNNTFFCPGRNGEILYLTKEHEEGFGNLDIYQIKLNFELKKVFE